MITLRRGLAAAGLMAALAQAGLAADASDERGPATVTVQAGRERSVNLNDVAATGSRLGLETKELPASVSVVTPSLSVPS